MNPYEIKKIVEFQSSRDKIDHLAPLALSTNDAIIKFMAKSILIQVYINNGFVYSYKRKYDHFQIRIKKEFITTIETEFDGVRVFDFEKGISYRKRFFLIKNKLVVLPSYGYDDSQETFNIYVSFYKKIKELFS